MTPEPSTPSAKYMMFAKEHAAMMNELDALRTKLKIGVEALDKITDLSVPIHEIESIAKKALSLIRSL